jgi:hypothetical protein
VPKARGVAEVSVYDRITKAIYSVMSRHERLFKVFLPSIERRPEEIGVIVFVPSFQRKRENSIVGWTVLALGHDSEWKRLYDPQGPLNGREGNDAAAAGDCRGLDTSQRIK